MIDSQRQEGGMDCGLFVVAIATAIAFGVDPSKAKFKQVAMRAHLAKCFEEEKISLSCIWPYRNNLVEIFILA